MEKTREEKDTMGVVAVPADRYWAAQTQRSLENFTIGGERMRMPLEVIRAFAILKKAAALVNVECAGLEAAKAATIIEVADEILEGKLDDHFPLKVFQTGSGTQTNMNVNEVIACRGHVLMGGSLADAKKALHPNDDVNQSQSSNDTFPTAMHIAAFLKADDRLLPALEAFAVAWEEKAKSFAELVKIGRTHLMDATPLTLGDEFSGYARQLRQAMEGIRQIYSQLRELALGGTAVGTGINAPRGYGEKTALKIAELTKKPFVSAPNKFAVLSAHDAIVALSGALRVVAVVFTKIGNDIRLLGSGPRCGIGELFLPANEPGSSIMPGKVNPTQAEALTMVAAQVIGLDSTVTVSGMQGHLQLNVFKPVMIYNVLLAMDLLSDASDSFVKNCVRGIVPNKKRIAENLQNSLMLVTALNQKIGYELAAAIAKKAHKEDLTLREAALALGTVSAEDFDRWMDPKLMIGER